MDKITAIKGIKDILPTGYSNLASGGINRPQNF